MSGALGTAWSAFYVVEAVNRVSDSFEVIGIFTLKSDAEQFLTGAEASGDYLAVAPPHPMKMGDILTKLVNDRLRELAPPIIQLATAIQGIKL